MRDKLSPRSGAPWLRTLHRLPGVSSGALRRRPQKWFRVRHRTPLLLTARGPAWRRKRRTDAAFRGLSAEHSPAVLRLATVLTGGDRGRVEDMVQLAPSRIRTRLGVGPGTDRISLRVL